jgi:D-glycero-alpha-D-manno-heptose-7-phosphate kinase
MAEGAIAARAPGRLDFAGGGTDPAPYCEEYGGAVVNAAIRLYSHVVVRPRPDRKVVLRSLDFGTEFRWDAPTGLPLAGPLDLIQAMVNRAALDRGFELVTRTELPPASGLSSSASMGIAVLAALDAFAGRERPPETLAHEHSDVERHDLHIWGGKQDPFACAFGGLNYLEFVGQAVHMPPFPAPEAVRRELEMGMVLVYSGEAHLSGNIHNDILADYRKGESRVREAQHRLKQVAHEARDALLAGDLAAFASSLDENWAAHQRLHDSCATPRLHHLIAVGKQAGALGAKVAGAGGGGCIAYFCPEPEARLAVEQALVAEGCTRLPFGIDTEGVRVWSRPDAD